MSKKDPFAPLDDEERKMMEGLDLDTDPKNNPAYFRYQEMLKSKTKRFSIMAEESDIEWYKEKAKEKGLPYQTFIKMTLHRYRTGDLIPANPF